MTGFGFTGWSQWSAMSCCFPIISSRQKWFWISGQISAYYFQQCDSSHGGSCQASALLGGSILFWRPFCHPCPRPACLGCLETSLVQPTAYYGSRTVFCCLARAWYSIWTCHARRAELQNQWLLHCQAISGSSVSDLLLTILDDWGLTLWLIFIPQGLLWQKQNASFCLSRQQITKSKPWSITKGCHLRLSNQLVGEAVPGANEIIRPGKVWHTDVGLRHGCGNCRS